MATYVTVAIKVDMPEAELRKLVQDTDLRDSGMDAVELDKVTAVDVINLYTRGEFEAELINGVMHELK